MLHFRMLVVLIFFCRFIPVKLQVLGDCSLDQYECTNGTCLDIEKLCNFSVYCDGFSVEEHCHYRPCSSGQYQCFDGTCIDEEYFCDFTPDCPDQSDEIDCYKECILHSDTRGNMYRGKRNISSSGRPCQSFDEQSPHGHEFYYYGKINYCRNDGADKRPWCFTLDPNVRWEFCSVPPCREISNRRCDFEVDMCGWKEQRGDYKEWIRQKKWTSKQEETILLADLSSHSNSKPIILFSSVVPPSNHRCFGMSYQIYGSRVERIDIYITQGINQRRSLTTGRKYKTNSWERFYVSMYETEAYGILIKIMVGRNGTGSIAMDDLISKPGICRGLNLCSFTEYQCDDLTCIDVHRFCDGISDCTDGSDERNCYINCLSKYDVTGSTYRGQLNVTKSGRICQRWNTQYPHQHSFTALEENYCRNPNNDTAPWCYTVDPQVRRDYCHVLYCESDCVQKSDTNGQQYIGRINTTMSGLQCKRWEYADNIYKTLKTEENYCRNPSGERQVWCYTIDPTVRWQFCNVPVCRLSSCEIDDPACQSPSQNGSYVDQITQNTISKMNNDDCLNGFKCTKSPLCLPKESVCNEIYECPQYDDELSCGVICPLTCSCKGLIISCFAENSNLTHIPKNTRVLHISGNAFSLDSLFTYNLPFLIHLNISKTSISSLTNSDIFATKLQSNHLQCLLLGDNKIQTISRYALAGLFRLRQLYLDNNPILTLDSCIFDQLNSLVRLSITNTKLHNISKFSSLPSLEQLRLQYNNIKYVAPQSLHLLSTASKVDLSGNSIKKIEGLFSVQMSKLSVVDLSYNEIENITESSLQGLYYLERLDLSGNMLQLIEKKSFSNMPKLLKLNLSSNIISSLEINTFKGLTSLRTLDLQRNKLEYIKAGALNGLSSIKYINLNHNSLYHIEEHSFLGMAELKTLFLQDNRLLVYKEMFYGLCKLEMIYADSYRICCAKPASVMTEDCIAPADKISSCNYLIDVGLLSISIWIVGLLTVVGNAFVLIFRCKAFRYHKARPHDILIVNLSMSDFGMGVYLLIIAVADLHFRGEYGYKDLDWRSGTLCHSTGIIATVSSEISALLLFVITLDRVMALKYPFSRFRLTVRRSILITSSLWVFSVVIATVPLVFESYYSRSSVCISLPLSTERSEGWQYSVGMFIGFNFLVFIGIVCGQLMIYLEVRKSEKRVSKSSTKEAAVARTVLTLALTDALCWIPIAILGLLTQNGIEISSRAYAWVIVFVLPINSALNPYLYTLSAVFAKKARKNGNTLLMKERKVGTAKGNATCTDYSSN